MLFGKETKIDHFLIASVIFLSVLAFLNLDNQYLWQDEAENAVIAKNILKYGYPRAFDGHLLVVSDIGYRSNYTWILQPWLQNYVTAVSFGLLGETTFAARFPFVLLGICSFVLSYFLAKRLFSLRVARISAIILVTSVPFLLMIRQARYYSLVLFSSLFLIHSYLDYVDNKKFADIKIILFSFLLFNSNFGLFFPLALGLLTHYLIYFYSRKNIKRDLRVLLIIAFLTIPVFIFFKGLSHRVPLTAGFILGNIKFYFRGINRYVAPIRLMLVLYMSFFIFRRRFTVFKMHPATKKNILLIIIISVATVCFMGIAKFRSLRYVIFLIPLVIIFESYFLSRWMRYNRFLAVICIALLISTDLFHHSITDFAVIPASRLVCRIFGRAVEGGEKPTPRIFEKVKKSAARQLEVKVFFKEYLYEITHDYDGPIEGIVRYLGTHAHKDDKVKIPYGDCAVAFYTGLKVDNSMGPGSDKYPEWVIPRDYWTGSDFFSSRYFAEIRKRYEKIILDYPDLRWENRPDDLGYHNFRTVRGYPKKVVIYRKIGASPA